MSLSEFNHAAITADSVFRIYAAVEWIGFSIEQPSIAPRMPCWRKLFERVEGEADDASSYY